MHLVLRKVNKLLQKKESETPKTIHEFILAGRASFGKDRHLRRSALTFAVVVSLWFLVDFFTKHWALRIAGQSRLFNNALPGLFRLHLVYNRGAAWGICNDSTLALGIISLAICIFLIIYLFLIAPESSLCEVGGLALVVAGGIGNACNRFALGYVVDFIEPLFVSFPVFNVADIGITCGFIIFIAGFLLRQAREYTTAKNLAHTTEKDECPRTFSCGDTLDKANGGQDNTGGEDLSDDNTDGENVGDNSGDDVDDDNAGQDNPADNNFDNDNSCGDEMGLS